MPLAESKTPAIESAALTTLGKLGDKTSVQLLASKLGSTAAAGNALVLLDGDGVNATIADAMKWATGKAKAALIDVLAARGQRDCAPELVTVLASSDRYAAKAACEALGTLGDKSTYDALIAMLAGVKPASASKTSLRQSVIRIAAREKLSLPAKIQAALPKATPTGKRDLLKLLQADGSTDALAIVASLLNDAALRTDAIRTLADWDSPAAIAPLQTVLKPTSTDKDRFLALSAIATHLPKAPAAERANAAAAVFTGFTALLKIESLRDAAAERILTAIPTIGIYAPAEAKPNLADKLNALFPLNLARTAVATSPTGLKKDGEASGPTGANDGDLETYWDEVNGKKRYRLRLTLPAKTLVGRLVLYGYKQHDHALRTFRVVSDAGVLATVKNAKYTKNRLGLKLKAATVQWIELDITAYYGQSPAIREVEIYASDDTSLKLPLEPKGLSWIQTKSTLALKNGGKTVWQYNFGPKLTKPYFAPIGPVGAGDLAWVSPPDHPWHYGLWFSWKYINKVNYWEENRKTRQPDGVTKLVSTTLTPSGDHSAHIVQKFAYHPAGTPKAVVLNETRTIEISAPNSSGGYTLDWTATFTAATDVVLDRTPIHGEGAKSWGGYAGLSVRFAKAFGDWNVIGAGTKNTGVALKHKNATGVDFSGTIGKAPCGMAILDHPSNPRYPTPWHIVMVPKTPFAYFNAAVICNKPLPLKKGESMTLRYRVAVHNGQWTAKQLNAAERNYRSQAKLPRALILTGANNHNWRETTPPLKAILETNNAFRVDVVSVPNGLGDVAFSSYDLIVSNWNSWGKVKQNETPWTPVVRKAFESAINSGVGHLTLHAGGCSFYNNSWPAYRKITLAYWKKGKTSHGRPSKFKLVPTRIDHPLVKSLKPFTHFDELWEQPGVASGAKVLLTATANGKSHASTLASQFGKGRCAATFLGDNVKYMNAPEFKSHLLTLAQWAARSPKETSHAK